MIYYSDNKLYQFFRNCQKFKFSYGNIWELIYGDSEAEPKLLVLVIGVDNRCDMKQEEAEAYSRLQYLSKSSTIPVVKVKFRIDQAEIDKVYFSDEENPFAEREILLEELREIFGKHGLPVKSTSTKKYLNSKVSSAYHEWQRNNLGENIIVSDIDLWVVESETPKAILEIKRSKIPIERWKPFEDDYPNFRLISKICKKAGLKFKIVYYHMGEEEQTESLDRPEDISTIKVFSVDFDVHTPMDSGRIVTLEEFIMSEEWI